MVIYLCLLLTTANDRYVTSNIFCIIQYLTANIMLNNHVYVYSLNLFISNDFNENIDKFTRVHNSQV